MNWGYVDLIARQFQRWAKQRNGSSGVLCFICDVGVLEREGEEQDNCTSIL